MTTTLLCSRRLEETDDLARRVEVDLPESWARSETGHGLHVAEDGVEEARACGEADGADGDCETCMHVLMRVRNRCWGEE